ncbi:MAG: hypothetical protein J5608_00145 [Alphaproteobacteria bacterium]|nr:hypothetical protein [Alphaproteobacteria bacterium]
MSLKKTIVVPAVFLGLFGGTLVSHDAAAVGGCYAHSSPDVKIGQFVQGSSKIADATVGGMAGLGLTWFTHSPFFRAAGTAAGVAIGLKTGVAQKLGGKIAQSISKDELCTDSNHCLQCDNDHGGGNHECGDTTVVTNGNKVYKCYANDHLGVIKAITAKKDKWQEWDIPVCSDSPVRKMEDGGAYEVELNETGRTVSGMPGILVFTQNVCLRITEKGCKGPDGTWNISTGQIQDPYNCNASGVAGQFPHATHCAAMCQGTKWKVGIKECENGFTPAGNTVIGNGIYARCEANSGPTPKPNPDTKTCRDKRKGQSAEALACCDVLPSESWFNEKTGKCICTSDANYTPDPNKKFVIDNNGRGACVDVINPGPNPDPNPNPVVVDPCDCKSTVHVQALALAKAKCSNVSAVAQIILNIERECAKESACNVNTFNANMTALATAVNADNCGVRPDYDVTKITNAVTSIDKRVAGFDTSVWKNAEGKFNTARLASDSIAGVVLGTVGGVVTGVVVKKNQVKKGFEDISCTVGGQVVGGYGDEIRVGMQ